METDQDKVKAKQRHPVLVEIIDVADDAYEDGWVVLYHDDPDLMHGDTLAKFIAAELSDTFDADTTREDAFATAAVCIECAIGQLERVAEALRDRLDQIQCEGTEP